MKSTGVIRKVDDRGAIIIPKDIWIKILNINTVEETPFEIVKGMPFEICYENDGTIILKPIENF